MLRNVKVIHAVFQRQYFLARLTNNHFLKSSMGSTMSSSSSSNGQHVDAETGVLKPGEKPSDLSDAEWKKRLSSHQYYVTREKGTERPFTGELLGASATDGVYHCICCGAQLFGSDTKFDSGSGWPSFYKALDVTDGATMSTNVSESVDTNHGMTRVEVTCKQCDAHLGHVFNDGPLPTGQRFCINSASLAFGAKKKEDK